MRGGAASLLPFDRLFVAQALAENFVAVTMDAQIRVYEGLRFLPEDE